MLKIRRAVLHGAEQMITDSSQRDAGPESGVGDAAKIAGLEAEIFTDPWSEGSIADTIGEKTAIVLVAEEDGGCCSEAPCDEISCNETPCDRATFIETPCDRTTFNEIVGYCIIYHVLDEAEIARIAVSPKFQRQGVGKKLLDYAEDICKKAGVRRLMLEVRESNQNARRFYIKNGFREDGTRKAFYDNPREDAVLMSKYTVISTMNEEFEPL